MGERFEALRVGDSDISQPRMAGDLAAQAEGPDRQPDEDKADDGGDPRPREDGDDQPRRAQNHQSVAERGGGGEGGVVHGR